ncbi:MAG TPA: sigma-70 family RNA polymerase sigma factor [Solirubrobacterales bacterium]|jgi:RNA polymerase sigma factor (sigma-70 family)|nr:sigma-70 family RNA polymerase sigma factor [Solirubrobacterales bacterium]
MSGLLSDDRLALRATKGDRRAFAAIFRRYHQSLYRYCLSIVGDSQDAQDALQSTMVKVLRALPGEERKIELKPWLYRIAHNESIELLRRRRDTRQLDAELAAPGSGLADDAASRERLRRLISDLDELPERQRGTLVMRELAGLDFAEIGAALGTSPAVARQTLYEARLSLRQMDEGREMSCEAVTKALSDGDGRVTRRRDIRAHLRTCTGCRRFGEEIECRERDLAALAPLPALAAAGLLQGLLGGHGAGGGGLAGALGGGAAKSFGASAALKGAATVAVVAAIGATAADRGGLIHFGLPGGGSQGSQVWQPSGAGSAEPQPTQAGAAAVGATAGSAAGAKGAGHLGASQAAKSAAGKANKTNAEADPAPTSQSNSVAHPRGKGHERQLPSASAHGQQRAASHKPANHETAGTRSHPAQPPKSSHPAHPSNPSAEKGPSSPPSSAVAPETHAHWDAATQAAGAEEASQDHEAGRKP